MSDIFTKAQKAAITHLNGPMMVLAGPGSGKTLVITYRTKYLIEECGVNPGNILVITFTKAAALEMQERFTNLMDGSRLPVNFGTFHAIFFKILRYAYNYSPDNIISEEVKFHYIKEIIQGLELEIDDENEFCSGLINEISMVKGDMLDLQHYYSKNCPEDVFKKIYSEYDRKLRISDKIDFDDMLILCYELLSKRKDILMAWQRKYKYILVDEFQDINRIQYEILKMLSLPENNLFIVGDDDQSIYRFRGARPEIMLNFGNDYNDAGKILLDKNFRSGIKIVESAGRLIKNNVKRYKKDVYAENQFDGGVEYMEFGNQTEENRHIAEEIRRYAADGVKYSDIAVLYRTNMGPKFLVEKLMEYNIPFRMKDSMPNLYEHWIAQDLFSYIKLALGNRERRELYRVMNRPKRYMSRDSVKGREFTFDELYFFYRDKEWMQERISRLEYDIAMIRKMNPYAAVSYIRQAVGYDGYLNEYADYRRMKPEELLSVADELLESSKPFATFEEWFDHIESYGQELKKQSEQSKRSDNAVEMSTMHSSKGLEYRIVFIIDANEGITPHSKSVLDEDMEEERRMFYVAVTRAKERVHIFYVKERFNKPVSVSRFVGEMIYDISEFGQGVEVVHKKYGEGIVNKNDSGKVVIYFPKLRKELVFDIKFAVSNGIIRKKEEPGSR